MCDDVEGKSPVQKLVEAFDEASRNAVTFDLEQARKELDGEGDADAISEALKDVDVDAEAIADELDAEAGPTTAMDEFRKGRDEINDLLDGDTDE